MLVEAPEVGVNTVVVGILYKSSLYGWTRLLDVNIIKAVPGN